jgi:thiol-disulfide isomerase/thioredoxin
MRNRLSLLILFIAITYHVSAQYTFTPDSILDGKINSDLLQNNYTWYAKGVAEYIPDDSICNKLKAYASQLSFIVVMGTWCSDSREHVPHFYKVMNCVGVNDSQIELIGTLRNKTSSHINLEQLQIEYVPTVIIMHKGKVVGKIIETPDKSLEEDLLNILLKP